MNKSYSPANIPTFVDGESMDEVRVKTINPLTQEANKLGIKMNALSNTVTSHANKISALEAGGGGGSGGSVDLGPLTTRVTNAERDIDNLEIGQGTLNSDSVTMKGQIVSLQTEDTAIKTRVSALEAGGGGGGGGSSTFKDLTDTPSTLVANSFVKVNAAGDALEFKDQNFLTSESYVAQANVHGEFTLGTGGNFSATQVANASVVVYASSGTAIVQMPTIVAKSAMPTAEQVRSGRSITIFGMTRPVTIKSPAGAQKLWIDGAGLEEYVTAPGESVTFYALHNGGTFTHYVVVGGRLSNATP